MTTEVYRYLWKGLELKSIAALVRPGMTLAAQGPAPAPVVDITATDPTAEDKLDIDAAMLSLGWLYQSTNPPTLAQGIVLRQEIGVALAADVSTVSDLYTDLLTANITTNACVLGFMANAVSFASVTNGYFRVIVDGVPVARGAHLVGTANLFLGGRVPLPPGAHVIKLQWRTDTGGTHDVRPVKFPEAEFATLLVREMSG